MSKDLLKAKVTNKAVFAQDKGTFGTLRYTINDVYSATPIGKLISGSAAITVDNTMNNIPSSVIDKDGGVFVLGSDMKVTIKMKALLANEEATESLVNFTVFTFDKDGKAQEIPNCSLNFKVPAKTSPTLVNGTFPYFTGAKGTSFAVMMKSNKVDGAYLQTSTVQPLLMLEMTTA